MGDQAFYTAAEAKRAGWHSRRHETNEAQTEARENYQRKARPAARIARRKRRAES